MRGGLSHTHCANKAPKSGTDSEIFCEIGFAGSEEGGTLAEVAIVVRRLLGAVILFVRPHSCGANGGGNSGCVHGHCDWMPGSHREGVLCRIISCEELGV